MEATPLILHSTTNPPFGLPSFTNNKNLSWRHFNKHLHYKLPSTKAHLVWCPQPFKTSPNPLFLSSQTSFILKQRTHLVFPVQCSYSSSTSADATNHHPLLKPFKDFSFEKLKKTLLDVNPIDVVKWSTILSVAVAVSKWTVNLLINPFFWMYFSWSWLFWPWIVAISIGVYGLYCFYKHSLGKASLFEQLALVTSVFTWLTLVPSAHFNGYLEGWPFVFFFVYHYFFFFNVSVRKRLYGDYYARPHDPKWDVNPPGWYRLLFCAGVMVAHWLAAFEGPELHLVPGGWSNLAIWILILVTLFMHYNATFYLAKYSEKVVVPMAVVQFGPYRWVRHPIYASTMLLFATYFAALRAPLSLLFVVVVCLVYYEQKAKLEEALMVETFGQRYLEYKSTVRYKFIPFVF